MGLCLSEDRVDARRLREESDLYDWRDAEMRYECDRCHCECAWHELQRVVGDYYCEDCAEAVRRELVEWERQS